MIPFHESRKEPNFWTWLTKRFTKHKQGHGDSIVVVCGGEQLGKSKFVLRTEWCLNQKQFYSDEKYILDNIVFDGKEYRKIMKDCEKQIAHNDEAGTNMYSRQAMTPGNVMTNKRVMVCGFKHLLHFLCIPDFFSIDTYIKNHRVAAIVRIYKNNKFKVWVTEKKIKEILKRKNYSVKPSSMGWWSDSDTTPEFKQFMKLYRKKERYHKTNMGGVEEEEEKKPVSELDIKKKINKSMKDKGFTQLQRASVNAVTRRTICNWDKEDAKCEVLLDI